MPEASLVLGSYRKKIEKHQHKNTLHTHSTTRMACIASKGKSLSTDTYIFTLRQTNIKFIRIVFSGADRASCKKFQAKQRTKRNCNQNPIA